MNASTFVTKCRDILKDNASHRLVGGQRSGVVDEGRVAMAACGENRIFKRPLARRFASYRVDIMVDASGSMWGHGSGKRWLHAAVAACALYNGLRTSGATVFVHPFSMGLLPPLDMATNETAIDSMNAVFRHPVRVTKHGGMTVNAAHGNHDSYCLSTVAAQSIADRKHQGKIVLVLSDGRPSCDYYPCGLPGCHDDEGPLIVAIEAARRSGLLVFGIGIEAEHTTDIYGERFSAIVEDAVNIYAPCARLLERYIQRG